MEHSQRSATPEKPLEMIKIRQIDQSDFNEVMAIETESFPPGDAYSQEVMERNRRDSHGGFLVAELDGTVVGYGVGVIHGTIAHINSMAVLTKFRNQGIGRSMLMRLIEYFAQHGALEVALEVSEENAAGIHLYESLGFTPVERIPEYYDAGAAAIVMSRPI